MEAVVKVTNYNRPPPKPPSTQTSQLCSVKLKLRRRRQSAMKVIRKRRIDMGKKQGHLWHPELLWPSLPRRRPAALPPTPFHYTTFRPIGLATENEEKRREGFRAFLFPLFLLNFSANISAV